MIQKSIREFTKREGLNQGKADERPKSIPHRPVKGSILSIWGKVSVATMEILKPFPAKQYWWNGGKLASNQESGWADDSRLDQVTSAAGYRGRSLKNSWDTERTGNGRFSSWSSLGCLFALMNPQVMFLNPDQGSCLPHFLWCISQWGRGLDRQAAGRKWVKHISSF